MDIECLDWNFLGARKGIKFSIIILVGGRKLRQNFISKLKMNQKPGIENASQS